MMNFNNIDKNYDASKIKNVIFDFGNVLLDIDIAGCFQRMSDLLGYETQPEKAPEDVLKAMHEYETGDISLETFIWYFQTHCTKEMPQGIDIINVWNSMLVGWQTGKLEMLENLRSKYKVFLLSNTNDLHLQWVYRDLKKNHEVIDFDDRFFDKTFYSHLVRMRKPNAGIYDYVQENTGLIPEETIFIDDIKSNLKEPKKLGWHVYHHNPSDNIIDVVTDKLRLL